MIIYTLTAAGMAQTKTFSYQKNTTKQTEKPLLLMRIRTYDES